MMTLELPDYCNTSHVKQTVFASSSKVNQACRRDSEHQDCDDESWRKTAIA